MRRIFTQRRLLRQSEEDSGYICDIKLSHSDNGLGRLEKLSYGMGNVRSNLTAHEIEENYGLLASILDYCDDAVLSKTLDGTITSWNAGAERMFGYTAAEMLGRPITTLAPKESPEEIANILARIRRDEHVDIETSRIAKDGRSIEVSLKVSPIKNSEGHIVGACSISRDITARKRSERAVRELEGTNIFLDSIIDNIPGPIYVKDAKELRLVLVNSALKKIAGMKKENMIGKSDYDLFPVDQAAALISRDRATIAHGGVVDTPEESIGTAKDIRWLHTKRVNISIPRRSGSGGGDFLLGIAEDITSNLEASRKIIELQERLSLALDSAELGAWEFDCVDGTTERTLRHDQIFGYKIVQPEWGMRIFESHVVPEDLEMVKKGFREVGAAGKINIECRIIWPDHSVHWILIAGKEFRNGKGEPVRLYGTVRDITDRKKAEAELGEIARIKSEFMAMASHEIRSPLAVIKIALHLLGKNLQKARKGEYDAIGIATRNIDRLARLVDEILGIEALDSGKMQCIMKSEDINALIREVMAGFGPLAKMKGIVLDFDPAEGLPKIPLDRDKVVQVMTNLISNALKFINTGHIKVRTMRHNGVVRIDTEDTGPGIKVDDIGKLFKSFSRISHEGRPQEQGTGLGLSISKKIVSAHGGEIGVESVFGKGATFFITLPLEQATPPIPGD